MGLYAHDDKRASQSDSDTSKCDEKLHKNGKSGEIKWIPLNNLLKKVDEDSSLEVKFRLNCVSYQLPYHLFTF